jgi:hypothetical protein
LVVVLTACSTCGVKQEADSRPSETWPVLPITGAKVSVSLPSHLDDWSKWIKQRAKELSDELGISEPVEIILIYTPGPVSKQGQEVIQWVAGYFDSDTKSIWLWLRTPFGTDIVFEEFKNSFYHEYLHWLDYLHGVGNPVDHNELFNQRIASYGWK